MALNRLVQSKANVQRTGQTTGLEALTASIASHGLRQNLSQNQTSTIGREDRLQADVREVC